MGKINSLTPVMYMAATAQLMAKKAALTAAIMALDKSMEASGKSDALAPMSMAEQREEKRKELKAIEGAIYYHNNFMNKMISMAFGWLAKGVPSSEHDIVGPLIEAEYQAKNAKYKALYAASKNAKSLDMVPEVDKAKEERDIVDSCRTFHEEIMNYSKGYYLFIAPLLIPPPAGAFVMP
jgi:phage antirepressor YoqD-like protein